MGSLFIIGNGFDLAHEMPTKYKDFKIFLMEKYEITEADLYEYINFEESLELNRDGGIDICDKATAKIFCSLIENFTGEDWKDFESSLCDLDLKEYIPDLDFFIDKEGDPDSWKSSYLQEDISNIMYAVLCNSKKFFKEWVNRLNSRSKRCQKKDFINLINGKEDFFLNFNYTDLLKETYKVNDICHIHGKVNDEIVYGHGFEEGEHDYEKCFSAYPGAADMLSDFIKLFKKDTKKAIEKNSYFFSMLEKKVNKIYSYGFSYSNVDLVYIEEICKRVDTNEIEWYLLKFNDREHPTNKLITENEEYELKIRECGFKGKFSRYTIL